MKRSNEVEELENELTNSINERIQCVASASKIKRGSLLHDMIFEKYLKISYKIESIQSEIKSLHETVE